MKVLVIAEDERKREDVHKAVLEVLQDKGVCFTTPHEESFVCCILIQPDLIIVCDYDEALTPPTTHGVGLRSYRRIKEVVPEDHIIRMGEKYFRYKNYAQSIGVLNELISIYH